MLYGFRAAHLFDEYPDGIRCKSRTLLETEQVRNEVCYRSETYRLYRSGKRIGLITAEVNVAR